MLNKPFLYQCANRDIRAKENLGSGSPNEWFSNSIINPYGYTGISFDFFINWPQSSLSKTVWVKRISSIRVDTLSYDEDAPLRTSIVDCDGQDFLDGICKFCFKYGLRLEYMIFQDGVRWDIGQPVVRKVRLDGNTQIIENKLILLDQVKKEIQSLSGGPLRIGKKSLLYGTSTLECYLSRTDAPWPGDVDWIILDAQCVPVAILEYKKHTLNTPMTNQKISNYYPFPDGRKYNRLAILRDFINPDLALVNVYYPTKPAFKNIKCEILVGKPGNLQASKDKLLPLPIQGNLSSMQNTFREILKML